MNSLKFYGTQHSFLFKEQTFVLSNYKAIYWVEHATLIISDVHLGKAGHFRKHGIPIPEEVHIDDFQKMNSLIEEFRPTRILFLGDLFHSESNNEWNDLVLWSNHHQNIDQILVEGNHDQLTKELYHSTSLKLFSSYTLGPFEFTHETCDSKSYNISGHVHPSIRLSGLARQSVVLPCFYFGKTFSLLPSFGTFTGNHLIKVKKGDIIFAVADEELIGIKP